MRGDPTELREVLTNLLRNALDAVDHGGSVLIGGACQGGRVRVEVTDDGAGIPEELQAKLFTPFFTTKGDRGTGLGLCLSQQIVERHGGEMQISSAVGQGTTAAFVLPEAVTGGGRDSDSAVTGPIGLVRPASILVVDDDPDVLTPLCRYLERSGYEVRGASSAVDALAQVEARLPDAIITDIAMPGTDGLELCRRLRALHPALPIILMTGRTGEIDSAQADRTGAVALLAKPFTMRQVIDLLARWAKSTPASP